MRGPQLLSEPKAGLGTALHCRPNSTSKAGPSLSSSWGSQALTLARVDSQPAAGGKSSWAAVAHHTFLVKVYLQGRTLLGLQPRQRRPLLWPYADLRSQPQQRYSWAAGEVSFPFSIPGGTAERRKDVSGRLAQPFPVALCTGSS